MLKQRIVTATVLLLTTWMTVFYCPPFLWTLATGCVAQILFWEFSHMIGLSSFQLRKYLLVSAFLQGMIWLFNYRFGMIESIIILAFWLFVVPLWLFRRWKLKSIFLGWIVGWIMIMPAWVAFQVLRFSSEGVWQFLFIMGIVWVADTVAYVVGKYYGQYKLSVQISPGKSWEGFAGGLIGVVIYLSIFYLFDYYPFSVSWFQGVFFVILLCVISVIGDLLESWLKRCAHIKDSSHLLPGHGGFYDRMDGLIAVMSTSVAFLKLFHLS
jgi:phosphatidate cytidylyltransferase